MDGVCIHNKATNVLNVTFSHAIQLSVIYPQMLATGESADSGIGMLMNLRKCANHPLLIRDHYDQHKLEVIARLLKTRDSGHKQAVESYIVEDLKIMSDFDINKTCETYRVRRRRIRVIHILCDLICAVYRAHGPG